MSRPASTFVPSLVNFNHRTGHPHILPPCRSTLFTTGYSLRSNQPHVPLLQRRSSVTHTSSPKMLQSPDADGPPSLDSFTASKEVLSSMQGASLSIGTNRVTVPTDSDTDSLSNAVAAGTRKAMENVTGLIRAIHVTSPPGVSARIVREAIVDTVSSNAESNDVCIFGRSIVKDGGGGPRIEIMVIAGGDNAQSGSNVGGNAAECAKQTLVAAAENMNGPAAFGIFVADGNFKIDQVRAGFKEIAGDFPMYGGCAQGVGEPPSEWAVIHKDGVRDVDNGPDGMVFATLFQGKLSFLLSALVKNWAQPKFVEMMGFLKPQYVEDPKEDLLMAIKFDDWDKFIECLESKGVDVNVKWTSRQNQSPLLAAVARGRYDMIEYLLKNGADVLYRNAGGFNAVMYTVRLKEYGDDFVHRQMELLVKYGADINDTEVIL